MRSESSSGHLVALFTILIWGTTFVSTKRLLQEEMKPVEILFLRFIIGYLCLSLVSLRPLPMTSLRREICLAAAGLCGITLYYLLENIALSYSLAGNVGVIMAVSPFFTALTGSLLPGEKGALNRRFFAGFLLSMAGISILSISRGTLHFAPLGDLLALLAAIIWAVYCILMRRMGTWGYPSLAVTRRIFFYGLLGMLPALPFLGFRWAPEHLTSQTVLFHLLFLGVGASALCFVSWNFALRVLGAVRTSIYIYMVPVVAVVTAALVLHERVTPLALLGVLMTLSGVLLSQSRSEKTHSANRHHRTANGCAASKVPHTR